MLRLAVLMTCRNRRQKTLRSVEAILQYTENLTDTRVFIVDDGSTDDTLRGLCQLGDRVVPISGNGSLFWSGGMRVAEAHASGWNPDLLLWLNDDLLLHESGVRACVEMLLTSTAPIIVVGRVADPSSGETTYGIREQSPSNPIAFPLASDGSPGVTFNGNFVLMEAELYRSLGGFPASYKHGYSDLVLGIRAHRAGVLIATPAGPVGFDEGNPGRGRMFDVSVPFASRIRIAISPFGMPIRDHWRFCAEVTGTFAPIWFLRSYARVVFPRRH